MQTSTREGSVQTPFETSGDIINQYAEYLETETMMPYDMIEKYVADFVMHERSKRAFIRWKHEHYPDLPFD